MRRVLTALAALGLALTVAAAAAWVNRVPLAEWAIATYQPETLLGPVAVRIREFSLSSITFAEIRAQYRGPLSVQDATLNFSFDDDWDITLAPIRVGSVNAALSFADWYDLLETLQGTGPESTSTGPTELPLTIGDIAVETLDLYAETPKGYALLNGHVSFPGKADLSNPNAFAQLAASLEGELLLSAGAAGFPVGAVIDGGSALGRGSAVLTASFAENTAKIEAITPISLDVDVTAPLPGLPDLPIGTYQADIGSDEMPFRVSLGYGLDPGPALRHWHLSPFPFSLNTPYGSAEAQATTGPMTLAQVQDDPTALDVGMKGRLDLSDLPMPGGGKASVSGEFQIDKGKETTIALTKGFHISADLAGSPLLAMLPDAGRQFIGKDASLTAPEPFKAVFAAEQSGQRLQGDGPLLLRSGPTGISLPSGFDLRLSPQNDLLAEIKTLIITVSPGRGAVAGEASFTDLRATVAVDGGAVVSTLYHVATDLVQSKGALTVDHIGTATALTIEDGEAELPATGLSVPSFTANAKVIDTGLDINASVTEILLGEQRAVTRPIVLAAHADFTDRGMDFNASGSIDQSVAIKANGSYADGDVTLRFGSGDIPLGPEAADLSELTDLIDLGRSDPNGSIRVEGELTYQNEAISGYADLHIAEIGSVLADGAEISVLGTVSFDLSRPPATLKPATLTGVLSSDILGKMPFTETFTLRETGEMEVQSLEAQILGGTVSIRDGLASPTEGSLAGKLHAEALNLEALADLMQIEGLEGTGRLTGDLKFHVTDETVVVEAGALRAEEPGILRYRGEALRAAAKGNENLSLLVQALENFHYEVLTLGIDIPEFGEGIVTLHLEGNNPDVLDGYPFDVTINLESEYGRLIKEFLQLYQEMDVILEGAVR